MHKKALGILQKNPALPIWQVNRYIYYPVIILIHWEYITLCGPVRLFHFSLSKKNRIKRVSDIRT